MNFTLGGHCLRGFAGRSDYFICRHRGIVDFSESLFCSIRVSDQPQQAKKRVGANSKNWIGWHRWSKYCLWIQGDHSVFPPSRSTMNIGFLRRSARRHRRIGPRPEDFGAIIQDITGRFLAAVAADIECRQMQRPLDHLRFLMLLVQRGRRVVDSDREKRHRAWPFWALSAAGEAVLRVAPLLKTHIVESRDLAAVLWRHTVRLRERSHTLRSNSLMQFFVKPQVRVGDQCRDDRPSIGVAAFA